MLNKCNKKTKTGKTSQTQLAKPLIGKTPPDNKNQGLVQLLYSMNYMVIIIMKRYNWLNNDKIQTGKKLNPLNS